MTKAETTGSCLCGAVRYAIDGPLGPIDHCHCSMCRRSHGAPFATFGRIRRSDLRIISGADCVAGYASSEAVIRSFCARCGSRLFFRHAGLPDHEFVAIPTLDAEPARKPEAHIFVGSKASWHPITDDLPQYAELPPMGDLSGA